MKEFFSAVELEHLPVSRLIFVSPSYRSQKVECAFDALGGYLFYFEALAHSSVRGQNGDMNIIVLSDNALAVLQQRYSANQQLDAPCPYVFPGDEDTETHLKDPKRAFERVKGRMDVSDIRIHYLRRTLASNMAINRASMPMIGQALNHKSQVSTAIYARLSQNPTLDAVNGAVQLMV